jgi:hypothetical protein
MLLRDFMREWYMVATAMNKTVRIAVVTKKNTRVKIKNTMNMAQAMKIKKIKRMMMRMNSNNIIILNS